VSADDMELTEYLDRELVSAALQPPRAGTALHWHSPRSCKVARMNRRISGRFEVKLVPLALNDPQADPSLGRRAIDKQFHGELQARSQGEMLSAGSPVQGSAGYVAIERVSGSLGGRSGSFVLMHNATMNRGVPQLSIVVVPDSGTGQLEGLSGSMGIRIEDQQHYYDFDYSLPDR